jgi:hypothetical protein
MSYRREHPSAEASRLGTDSGHDVMIVRAEPVADPSPRRTPARRPARKRAANNGTMLAIAMGVHALAAALIYSLLVTELYALIEHTPRLASLERGLVRLLAVIEFLPPFAPTVLLAATAVWLGDARKNSRVARALVYGALALAADTVLRLVGVSLSVPPENVGELLDLPARYSPGARMIADLLGVEIAGSGALYWLVVCSIAAAVVVTCVSRALVFAEEAALDPVDLRRRRARGTAIVDVQCFALSAIAFGVIAFVGQLALPFATQFFLEIFG